MKEEMKKPKINIFFYNLRIKINIFYLKQTPKTKEKFRTRETFGREHVGLLRTWESKA